jgi:hypothetical protein
VYFAKLYAEYEARCRSHGGWARPRDDLWDLTRDSDVNPGLLTVPGYAAAFWVLLFGDPIDGAWADESLDWPTETQWARFHEATASYVNPIDDELI